MKGVVSVVEVVPVRAFLSVAAELGDATVAVNDGAPFAIAGTSAILGGETYGVDSVMPRTDADDPDVLVLDGPVTVAVEAQEPVTASPSVDYTYAVVTLADGTLVEEVVIDQDFQDRLELAPGPYPPESRPVVDVEWRDDLGQYVVVGVDGRGALDGSGIENLPPSPPPEPVQPESSPVPTVDGFAGVILARWLGVINETPVMYDVHVSASNASAPSSSTLVDTVASTSDSIRTLADGTPLAYDTTYYVAIVARSGDLGADPSPWVPGMMDRTRSADLAADAIDGMTITGATIRTASAGAREQITTADGYESYNSAGEVQTSIKDGRLVARDGEFTGNVEGASIVGGTISVGAGAEPPIFENFSTASGTTPPTGWTLEQRTAGNPMGVQFEPWLDGKAARFNIAGTQNALWQMSANGFNATNVRVLFDIDVAEAANGGVFALVLREDPFDSQGNVRIVFSGPQIILALGTVVIKVLAIVNATDLIRVEVILKGYQVRVRVVDENDEGITPWFDGTLPSATLRSGGLGFASLNLANVSSPNSVRIDNVVFETLPRGLEVAEDGFTSVQQIEVVEQLTVPLEPTFDTDAASKHHADSVIRDVPDPTDPTDAVNLRTMQAAIIDDAPQGGTVPNFNVNGNSFADYYKAFPRPFSATPGVACTITNTTNATLVGISVRDVTATGFTARVYRNTSGSGGHGFSWVAAL